MIDKNFLTPHSTSASSGNSSKSEATGIASAVVVSGLNGKAKAAAFGCIALSWWNAKHKRAEMRCALIGTKKGQLKADTWYALNAKGAFVQSKP